MMESFSIKGISEIAYATGIPSGSVEDSPTIILGMVLLISILAVAFFSSSEAALISVNKFRIQHKSQLGDKSAKSVIRVISKHEKFFATILLTENAFIILSSSIGTAMAISLLGGGGTTILIATLAMTAVIVLFGEITPKSLAAQSSDTWSLLVARPIEVIMRLETWVIFLFTLLPRIISHFIHRDRIPSPSVTEGELRMLIDIAEEEGVVEPDEAEMLEKVFHFGDNQVNEVITPRHDVVWVTTDTTKDEFLRIYSSYPYSRFPVCNPNLDSVVGILSVKDVIRAIAQNNIGPNDPVTVFSRDPLFVPENRRVSELLKEFQQFKYSMAIVVDELGISTGVVTLHDLLEVVMGPLEDNDGIVEEKEISSVDDQTFEIRGNTSIEEINRTLGISVPEGDYNSIAGLLLEYLGHIPSETETLELENFTITVAHVRGVKIERVLLSIHSPTSSNVR